MEDPKPLLNPEKYQVFLFASPAVFPFSFARHLWFVINKRGVVSRWEIFRRPGQNSTSWGQLHKDFYPPFSGITKFPFSEKYIWKYPCLIGYVEGDANSYVRRMAEFIETSPESYPYCDTYFLSGPNSNTYAQWVLDKFPETKLSLPKSSIGKKYKNSVNYDKPIIADHL